MKIKKIKKIDYKGNVYNLRIKSSNDLNHNYFANGVCVSNCHHTVAGSVKKIITNCINAKYKVGLTGTMPKPGSFNSYTIQSYLGPTVFNLTSKQLIDEGNATPIKVVSFYLDYLPDDSKEKLYKMRSVHWEERDGLRLLNLERRLIRENRERFLYICDVLSKSTKNGLVLFADVQGGYGRKIYDWLRENTEKNVYYIDGGTKNENREFYKNKLMTENNVIIISSLGTFSEGVDAPNIHSIFVVEPSKSSTIVSQQLGRGMRLMKGKEFVTLVEFVDDFRYGEGNARYNYLVKHAKEREQLYKKKKFPFKKFQINLKTQKLF